MPPLWSPEDLATRFAPYIEELRDVFAMHRLHYGSADDIRPLVVQLEMRPQLHEELAALVRSIVLREGGSIPRTDLLEIVAIAITGPQTDPEGEELQHPVRQLLAFLHNALRRPWNEPPGEECGGLSTAESPPVAGDSTLVNVMDSGASALHGREPQAEGLTEVRATAHIAHPPEHHSARANVIPFGRARAVFSRLARTEADDLMEDAAGAKADSPSAPAPSLTMEPLREIPTEATFADRETGCSGALAEASAVPSMMASEPAEPNVASNKSTRNGETALLGSGALLGEADLSPEAALPHAVPPASTIPPADAATLMSSGPSPGAPLAAPIPHFQHAGAMAEFDEEPPLPAAPRINHIALTSGIAATLLLAAGLATVLRARPGTRPLVAAGRPLSTPANPQKAASGRVNAIPSAAATSTATPQTLKVALRRPRDGDAAEFDDGYVAPPYSNVPPRPPIAADAGTALSVTEPSGKPASNASNAPAQNTREPHVVAASDPPDPDANIVGDPPSSNDFALAEPPIHPNISAAIMAQNLLSAPRPDYPALAKFAHVDGQVVLRAEITRGGTVADTQVISGHFLLRRAAEAAVRHWRFRPYQVGGKAVPVSTTVTVRFRQEP